MPTPKNLQSYPDEYFAIVEAFNNDLPQLVITESTPGAAINKRQHFYAFRKLLLEQQPLALGASGAQIQCSIAKGSCDLVFTLSFRTKSSKGSWNDQITAQWRPPIKASRDATQLSALERFSTVASVPSGLTDATPGRLEPSSAPNAHEDALAAMGFGDGSALRTATELKALFVPGHNDALPPAQTPHTSPPEKT